MEKTLATTVAFLSGILSGCIANINYLKPFNEVFQKIEYRETVGYVQSPYDTKQSGFGDCSDKAILLLDEWRKRGINGKIKGGKILAGSKDEHSWCEVDYRREKVVFDHTLGIYLPRKILDKAGVYVEDGLDLDFFEVMRCMGR